MATLKCLACGHDNNVGDEWCASCSSSLNLRLCSACEAINANDAERCHSCNAEFRMEPEVVTFEMDAPPSGDLVEQSPPAGRTLPAVWRMATDHARAPRWALAAALAALPLALTGLGYYFYAPSEAAKTPQPAAKVEAAEKSQPEPKANPEVAPSEPARQVAEPKQVPPPAVSGKIAPSRPASALSRGTPLAEPKRTTAAGPHAAVTHTRAASADASARTTGVETQTKTTAATLPAATIPVVAAPAPAASAALLPVSESAAASAESQRASVTHTKADLNESAIATTVPAAVTQVRTGAPETRNDASGACPPAVAALSLCKSR